MTPFKWWSVPQLAAITRHLQGAWTHWLAQWREGLGSDASATSCVAWDDEGAASRDWLPLGAHADSTAWWSVGGEHGAALSGLLFGQGAVAGRCPPQRPGVASGIALTASGDLRYSLCRALGVDAENPAAPRRQPVLQPWAGTVSVALRAGGATLLHLLLSATLFERMLPAELNPPRRVSERAPLEPFEIAWAPLPVTASATLNDCELDLASLCSLRPGDVIPLPHALDAPLQLRLGDEALYTAHLGRRGDAKAVELSSSE